MYDFTETTTASSRELELTHRLQLNTKYFVLEYVASELMVVSGLSRLPSYCRDFFAKAGFADLQDSLLLR